MAQLFALLIFSLEICINNGHIEVESNNFEEVLKSEAFVDKSLLIKEFFIRNVMVITAPKRFGKSTNMNMIKTFLEHQVDLYGRELKLGLNETKNYKLFKDNKLEIYSNYSKFFHLHFAQYPVIHLNFKNLSGETEESFLKSFNIMVNDAYMKHEYLLKYPAQRLSNEDIIHLKESFKIYAKIEGPLSSELEDTSQLNHGLYELTWLLYNHFRKKSVVLIDDYDSPIQTAIHYNQSNIEYMVKLLGKVTSALLESNKFVTKGIINSFFGFDYFALDSLNRKVTSHFLKEERLSKFYGFTDVEVKNILEKFDMTNKFGEIKKWYSCEGNSSENIKGMGFIKLDNIIANVDEFKKNIVNKYRYDNDCIKYIKKLCKRNREFRGDILRILKYKTIITKYFNILTIKEMDTLKELLMNDYVQKENRQFDPRSLFFQYLVNNGYLNVIKITYGEARLPPSNKNQFDREGKKITVQDRLKRPGIFARFRNKKRIVKYQPILNPRNYGRFPHRGKAVLKVANDEIHGVLQKIYDELNFRRKDKVLGLENIEVPKNEEEQEMRESQMYGSDKY